MGGRRHGKNQRQTAARYGPLLERRHLRGGHDIPGNRADLVYQDRAWRFPGCFGFIFHYGNLGNQLRAVNLWRLHAVFGGSIASEGKGAPPG